MIETNVWHTLSGILKVCEFDGVDKIGVKTLLEDESHTRYLTRAEWAEFLTDLRSVDLSIYL